MNLQEAIKVLNNEKKCVMKASSDECNRKCADCLLVMTDKDILLAYDMAIQALESMPEYERLKERDRAMKPLPSQEGICETSMCPNCKAPIWSATFPKQQYNFCCECGQRIDWTEQEDTGGMA